MSVIDVSEALMNVKVERLQRVAKTKFEPPRTLDKSSWPPRYEEVIAWRKSQLSKFKLKPKLLDDAIEFYRHHPVEFINHWCDTADPRNAGSSKSVWMPFILFKKQEELVRFVIACLQDEEHGLVEKSRDMGATWVCVALSVWMWLFWPGIAIGWGSQDAVSVDRIGDPKSIFWKIRGLIERIPDVFKPELRPEHTKQYACINPQNHAAIIGEVGDNIGRGGRTRIYFKDESAHYEHPEVIEASLSDNTRVAIDISSVNGLGNVFHRRRESGLDWYPGAQLEKGRTRIFVMDWRDHPAKNQDWYDTRHKKAEGEGLLHVLAQEVDRNYAAAVQGTIINPDWIKAAIDAHIFLGFSDDGGYAAGLDVADEGYDTNALALRKGVVLRELKEWGERDPGVTTRRAIAACEGLEGKIDLMYDCIGVGVGVKTEANRLKLDDPETAKRLKHINLVPWNAGAAVLNPNKRVLTDENGREDKNSPRNEDFYHNLKAQAWWELRTRFYKTWRAVQAKKENKDETYDPNTLISLDSRLVLLRKLEKELAQPTASKSTKMKLLVDKAPDGTKSPNLGDAVVMCYWPVFPKTGFAFVGAGPKIYVGGKDTR